MKCVRYILLCLCFLTLRATVNEPFRWEVFSGYRNDRIHQHTPILSEIYRDVEFWENGLVLKAIHRDLAFFLKGSYSALITHGWAADVAGYFGYAVNLTTDRTYKR